jgi:hypothetical protein
VRRVDLRPIRQTFQGWTIRYRQERGIRQFLK